MCVYVCLSTVDTVFSVEVGGNETQFTLRELQPNQAYRLRIAAGTGIGFGVPSEWAQHFTLAHYNHSDHSMGKKNTGRGSQAHLFSSIKFPGHCYHHLIQCTVLFVLFWDVIFYLIRFLLFVKCVILDRIEWAHDIVLMLVLLSVQAPIIVSVHSS